MSVTIGRASLDDLYDLRVRGSRVSFRTDIEGSDVYEMKALRQQLAGLADNRDEEVVPFTWSEDATLDGFYRVVGTSVGSSDVMLSTGFVPEVDVELEQLRGFGSPWFEVTTQSVVMTNGLSVTAPSGVVAVHQAPTGAYQYQMGDTIKTVTPAVATCDTADEVWRYKTTAPMDLTAFRFRVAPADFYVGSCVLEVKYGSSWYPVVGRELAVTPSTVWRISNGLVRLTSVDGSTAGTIEVWGDTGWEAQSIAYSRVPTSGVSSGLCVKASAIGSEGPPTVVRNSPETVVVTCFGTESASTFVLHRGAYHVGMVPTFYSPGGTGGYSGRGLCFDSATGCTSFTGGVWRSSADAYGNGLTFVSPLGGAVKSTTQGGIAGTSGSMIAVGVNLNAANSTVAATLRDEVLGATSWQQRVVVA